MSLRFYPIKTSDTFYYMSPKDKPPNIVVIAIFDIENYFLSILTDLNEIFSFYNIISIYSFLCFK